MLPERAGFERLSLSHFRRYAFIIIVDFLRFLPLSFDRLFIISRLPIFSFVFRRFRC